MGIIGGLFWVVFGIIYVVYRLYKEDKFKTLSILRGVGIVILPPLIASVILKFFDTNIITVTIAIVVILSEIPLFILDHHIFQKELQNKELQNNIETDFQYQTKLERLQDDKLGELLGCPLNKIPLNPNKHKNDADSQRRGLAIKEIMRENGRTYSYQFRPWMGDSTNYPQEFLEFVKEYKNTHS